jgi:hypothetical protein
MTTQTSHPYPTDVNAIMQEALAKAAKHRTLAIEPAPNDFDIDCSPQEAAAYTYQSDELVRRSVHGLPAGLLAYYLRFIR